MGNFASVTVPAVNTHQILSTLHIQSLRRIWLKIGEILRGILKCHKERRQSVNLETCLECCYSPVPVYVGAETILSLCTQNGNRARNSNKY
jgi:hypothetical protein